MRMYADHTPWCVPLPDGPGKFGVPYANCSIGGDLNLGIARTDAYTPFSLDLGQMCGIHGGISPVIYAWSDTANVTSILSELLALTASQVSISLLLE